MGTKTGGSGGESQPVDRWREEERSMKTSFNEAILRSLIMISNAWCLIFLTSSLPCCSFVAYLFVSVKWFPGGFGVFLCKLLLFLAYLSISASVLTLAIMTIDRYFAIVRPMRRPLSACPPTIGGLRISTTCTTLPCSRWSFGSCCYTLFRC